MKASGTGFSSRQRSPWLCCSPCPEKSKCIAELSAGCHRPPWKETTAWRSASGRAPSTAGRTRWGRRTSASWRMWCSTPGQNNQRSFTTCCSHKWLMKAKYDHSLETVSRGHTRKRLESTHTRTQTHTYPDCYQTVFNCRQNQYKTALLYCWVKFILFVNSLWTVSTRD